MAFNPDKCLCFHAKDHIVEIKLKNYQFSKDGVNWVNDTISLTSPGEIAYCKGTRAPEGQFEVPRGDFDISGSLTSLIDDGAGEPMDVSGMPSCFQSLFANTGIVSFLDDQLVSGITKLSNNCFYYMFSYCPLLEDIPANFFNFEEIPDYALCGAFEGCPKVTLKPGTSLHAKKLGEGALMYTLSYCTSITEIPDGFFTTYTETFGQWCFTGMFQGAGITKLSVDCLPFTSIEPGSYECMFQETQISEIPVGFLKLKKLSEGCYANMFADCKNLTEVPKGLLPATTLASNCYEYMFLNCSSLKRIYVPFSNWGESNATRSWVSNVSATGVFYCPKDLPQLFDQDHIPTGWEVKPLKEPEFNTMIFKGNLKAPWNRWKTT